MVYSLIRLGIFAAALALLLLTQMTPWIAAALAAVIALCASYIVLRKPREELATGLYEARHGEGRGARRAPEKAGSDEENEDAVVDRTDIAIEGTDAASEGTDAASERRSGDDSRRL